MFFHAQNLSIGGVLGLATLVGVLGGCPDNSLGTLMPAEGLHYPMGTVLLPESDLILVPSSNFDLRYASGNLHLLDQEAFDALLEAGDGPVTAAVPDVALGNLTIRSFASDPVLLPGETPLLGWLHRRDTGLFGAQVSDTQLACLNPEENGCGPMSDSELMPENPARPFTTGNRLWVPHLASAEASVFAKSGDDEAWAHERTLSLSPWLLTARVGATTRSISENQRLWFAGALPETAQVQAGLLWGLMPEGEDAAFEVEGTLNVTELTGSTSVNDLAWFPNETTLAVALRNPDGLALFEVAQKDRVKPSVALTHLEGSCDDPTRLLPLVVDTKTYLALSCMDENTVRIHRGDDLTLVANRIEDGEGPRNLSWDATRQRLWVTYFKSHFLAAYELSHVDGSLSIELVGTIGSPRPSSVGVTP